MGAERVVGCHRDGDQVGPRRLRPLVDVLAVVAVGPAVERAVAHRGQVIGDEVAADLVALVDDREQGVGLGLPGQSVRVAQAGGEEPLGAGLRVDLPDRGPAFLVRHALLADVAVRADRRVEPAAVAAGDDVLGPVVIDRAARQVDDLASRLADSRLARLVREAHDRVGVGDVEVVADERHAERRHQPFEEGGTALRDAVAVAVAQQGDPVRARHAGAGARHHLLHDPALDAAAVFLGRRVGLGDEHVAVRQHVKPARMRQAGRVRRDRQAARGSGPRARRPADGGCDVDGRKDGLHRRRQSRARADARAFRQARHLAACGQSDNGQAEEQSSGNGHRESCRAGETSLEGKTRARVDPAYPRGYG